MSTANEIQRFGATRNAVSQATTIEQSRAVAEVQAQVVVAQNCPRDTNRAVHEIRESCGRLSMAERAFYAVPNRGEGASVHLLRECARAWGNIQHGSQELHRDDAAGVSEVQSWAWDIETNTRASRTFIAPHERQTKHGRTALTDLTDIQNNNNSVAARAVRECISHVLPRWFVEEAADRCRQTLEHGEGEPILDRIATMVDWFAKKFSVTVEQIEARLEKKRGQWDAADVAAMKIAGQSIVAGEATKAELFPAAASSSVNEIAAAPAPEHRESPTPSPEGNVAADEKPKRTRRTKAEMEAARAEVEGEVVARAVAADQAQGNFLTTPAPGEIDTDGVVITSVEGTTGEDLPGTLTAEKLGKPVRLPGEPKSDMLREPNEPEPSTRAAVLDADAMPQPVPGPITGQQMGTLFNLRAKAGYPSNSPEGNADWARFLTEATGRNIAVARDLSDAEAAIVIDTLEAAQQ